MISSMTGYGRGLFRSDGTEVAVEIRSVNNRYLDISMKMPRMLSDWDQKARELIGKHVSRGRISVVITLTSQENPYQSLSLNKPLADMYIRIAKKLKQDYKLRSPIDVNQLMNFPDLIISDSNTGTGETYWSFTEKALTQALEELVKMRRQEGLNLLRDFEQRIATLDEQLKRIEQMAEDRPRVELEKLRGRIGYLLPDQRIDDNRLELELALIADRLDITEECVRFHSHNKEFVAILEKEEAPGRKLNFLLQEMHREINTMSNKAANPEISHIVVQVKDEIEKMREQVQNIE
jgi:uncharacterized protein (TIGR00255 family)